jgi:hypothetical protein
VIRTATLEQRALCAALGCRLGITGGESMKRACRISIFTIILALSLTYSQDYFNNSYWHWHNIIFAFAMGLFIFVMMAPLCKFRKDLH